MSRSTRRLLVLSVLVAALSAACRKSVPSTDAGTETSVRAQQVWATPNGVQHELVAGGRSFYWMNDGQEPNVLVVRGADGIPRPLWTVDGYKGRYLSLAATDEGALVTEEVQMDGGSVAQTKLVPANGAEPYLFVQTLSTTPLVVDGPRIAFADTDRVMVAELGKPATLVAKTEMRAIALALRGGRLAWIERKERTDAGLVKLATLDADSAAPRTIGTIPSVATGSVLGQTKPFLALDDQRVYIAGGVRVMAAAEPERKSPEIRGYTSVLAVDASGAEPKTVYTSDWPIDEIWVVDHRIYVWETDPTNYIEGRLRSVSLEGSTGEPREPRLEATSRDTQTGARPPFVFDDKWIWWTNVMGLCRVQRRS